MENNKIFDLSRITAIKIQRINPENYEMFFEALEEEAKDNKALQKNLNCIKELLDYMKSEELHKEQQNIICKVCEYLIHGMDINLAINEVEDNRNKIYVKIMGTNIYKIIPHIIRMHVIKIFKIIHHRDNEILGIIKGIAKSFETRTIPNNRHKELCNKYAQPSNGFFTPQLYPRDLTTITPNTARTFRDRI